MVAEHLHRHGQSYFRHLSNNLHFTWLALKAAVYTLGHGIHPKISGLKASQIHSQLWEEGRKLSMEDIQYRLQNNLYSTKDEALKEFQEYAQLYDERPVFANIGKEIDNYFKDSKKTV